MKTPLILNLVWAGAAGAAFYTGYKLSTPGDANESAQSKIRPVASSLPGSPFGTGNKTVSHLMVSKSQDVLDFYKRFGLDNGTPLTPDKMKEAMLEAIRESDPVKRQL